MTQPAEKERFIPEHHVGKPARFGWSAVWPELGQSDGRGRAPVVFHVQFSLQDQEGKSVTADGYIQYSIELWRSTYYSNDPRMVMLGSPATYEAAIDQKKIKHAEHVSASSFHRATDAEHNGLLFAEAVAAPLGLKTDVVEWRYCYALWWFLPATLFGFQRIICYDGHKSVCKRFDFRGA